MKHTMCKMCQDYEACKRFGKLKTGWTCAEYQEVENEDE